MTARSFSEPQRKLMGKVIADPRGRMRDTLGLWFGPTARTYNVLLRDGMLREGRRRSRVGLGREIIWVHPTAAGRKVYAAGAHARLANRELLSVSDYSDSLGAGC